MDSSMHIAVLDAKTPSLAQSGPRVQIQGGLGHQVKRISMLFQPNPHSPRRRSSSSKAIFERPGWTAPRPFIYATNAGYARGTLRGTLNLDLRTFLL